MSTDDPSPSVISRIPLAVLAFVVPVIALIAVLATNPTWSSASSAPGTPSTSGSTIRIHDFAFSPPDLRVAPGTKIIVLNSDSTTHTLTAADGKFDTSNLKPSKQVTITAPTTPGRYRFTCQIHPNMVGTLVVTAS